MISLRGHDTEIKGSIDILATKADEHKLLAASFFCAGCSVDCTNSVLCETLDQDPDIGTKNLTEQFEKVLKEPQARVKGALPANLVVVIDALDECEDRTGVERTLDMLFRYAADVPLRFLVTSSSRPEPEIYQWMTQNSQSRVFTDPYDIEESLVQVDNELYLKGELVNMSLTGTASQVDQLVNQSGVLFIYAAILIRYIKSGARFDTQKRLRSVLGIAPESARTHAQIDALYTAALKSALSEEELEVDKAADVQAVLRTALFAQEPISIKTIATLRLWQTSMARS
ncbi:hypothetical protein RSAG8_04128, partial [Rhizoctonia solani AG-8 WAC10335]